MSNLNFQFFDCDNHYYEANGRLHPPHRAAVRQARDAVGRQSTARTACWSAAKVNHFIPNPHLRPGLQAGRTGRVLPRA